MKMKLDSNVTIILLSLLEYDVSVNLENPFPKTLSTKNIVQYAEENVLRVNRIG